MIYGAESQFSQRRFSSDNTPYEKIGNNDPVSIADEVPFEIPDTWEWARLGQIVFNRGQCIPQEDFCYIDIGSINNKQQCLNSEETVLSADKAPSRARKLVAIGDILYSTVRPYLHNMCIIDRSFSRIPIASTGFAVMTCHSDFYNKYLFYYLMSPDFDAYANDTDNAKGVAYPAINDDRLYRELIPIPPVSEQYRIVAKMESLQGALNEYGIKETELRTVNDTFPEQLKKSILQMAVQGKLLPQDPDDEPASVLLERIRTEKQRLIAEGKIKRDKHESVIFRRDNSHYEKCGVEEICIDNLIPFDIPESWIWVRLITLIEEKPVNGYSPKGVGYSTNVKNLTLTATTSGHFKSDAYKYVDIEIPADSKYWLKHNDILIQRSNSRELVGTVCIYAGEDNAFIYPDLMMRIRIMNGIDIRYIDYALKSPFIRQYYTSSASGTSESMPKINQTRKIKKH